MKMLSILLVVFLPLVACHRYSTRLDDLGGKVVLNCSSHELEIGQSVRYWMEPEIFDVIYPGQESKGRTVSDDGFTLTITSVDEYLLGDYFCLVIRADGSLLFARTTLFLYEPTFMDLYRMNLIVGLTATGIFLVFAITACCIYVKLFERVPEDDDVYSTFDNQGYAVGPAVMELNGKHSYQVDTKF